MSKSEAAQNGIRPKFGSLKPASSIPHPDNPSHPPCWVTHQVFQVPEETMSTALALCYGAADPGAACGVL